MDQLDLLLEELALSTVASNSVEENQRALTDDGQVPGAGYAGLCKDKGLVHSNVYSDLPPPVTATVEPDSPTKELDFILQDLMRMGDQDPASPSIPPPLTKKESVKRQTEGEQEERTEESASGSDSKASTTETDSIDKLLGGLTSDLQKIGVRTTAKGHCASCKKCIVGKMITALGEVWHPEHFVCTHCKTELSTTGFFEREGRPYCHKDYHDLFSPRCAYCKGPIVQSIVTALDQSWHPEHFFCMHCGELFGPAGFMEKEGKPYCTRDFYQLFAPKCSGCGESVRENYLTAANGTWHPECFVCADCLKPFSGGGFMELDGRPLCSLHFHTRQGTLCGSCGLPITGRCISALDRKFHPEHFVCAFCQQQLSQGIFKEQRGKPYCSACYHKVFV